MRKLSMFLAAVTLLSSVRCATVADGRHQEIIVTSDPPGASLAVDCGSAPRRPGAKTPAVLELPRAADPCRIVATKEGYEHASISLAREFSPRALSNFTAAMSGVEGLDAACCDDDWMALIGVYTGISAIAGTVGFAVDRATGAMYRHTPEGVHFTLRPLDELEEEEVQ